MNSSVLFIIDSDPRISPRPAEAIRIAAGVGAARKAVVNVYLRGAAVLALSEYPDELIDSENYTQYLPILGELSQPIYVQKEPRYLGELGAAPLRYQGLSDEALADLAAQHNHVARF